MPSRRALIRRAALALCAPALVAPAIRALAQGLALGGVAGPNNDGMTPIYYA
jgi:hypothetical protein